MRIGLHSGRLTPGSVPGYGCGLTHSALADPGAEREASRPAAHHAQQQHTPTHRPTTPLSLSSLLVVVATRKNISEI